MGSRPNGEKYSASPVSCGILIQAEIEDDRIIRSAMDQSYKVSLARSEVRQHTRCVVPPACLLSFAPFAPTISFNGDTEGEGIVLDLSLGGCKISSEVVVNVGDAMSLIILLPGAPCPTAVDLVLVRWRKDLCFGVEFVSMGTVEHNRLSQFLASTPMLK